MNKKAEAAYGYATVVWLTAKVFLDRDFVDEVRERGVGEVAKECPFGNDLTPGQEATFEATLDRWELRLLVKVWWVVYDFLRERGTIPGPESPWRP